MIFEPEKFGDWTLRETRRGCWSLTTGESEIEVDSGSDYAGVAGYAMQRSSAFSLFPPVDALARMVALREQFLASLPTTPFLSALAPEAQAPAVASERPGLARLLEWARGAEREASSTAREIFAEKPGNVPLHEGRHDAYADCVREIEREIAALGPPSLAEDLRAPEPGAFDGAVVVGGDDQLEREIEALAREVTREDRNRAVREALAELRGILTRERAADNLSYLGIALAARELDEFAERFKP